MWTMEEHKRNNIHIHAMEKMCRSIASTNCVLYQYKLTFFTTELRYI